MKNRVSYMLGAGLVAAGLLVAQTPQTNQDRPARTGKWAQGQGMKGGPGMGAPMGRMAQHLNLTDNQKTQAQAIFKSAAENSRPVATQMREARQALNAAAKRNAPPEEINRLSQTVGTLQAQLAASRAQSFAQFYQILTQEQREKLDAAQDRMKNRGEGQRRGFRGAGKGKVQQ
jgi:Spy/CpxP family protein refolding chaperone